MCITWVCAYMSCVEVREQLSDISSLVLLWDAGSEHRWPGLLGKYLHLPILSLLLNQVDVNLLVGWIGLFQLLIFFISTNSLRILFLYGNFYFAHKLFPNFIHVSRCIFLWFRSFITRMTLSPFFVVVFVFPCFCTSLESLVRNFHNVTFP